MPLSDQGNWQYYCEVFDFPAWNGAVRMCWMCAASATIAGLLFKKCSDAAGWRGTRISHEAYLAEVGDALPSLFRYAVGLRLECVTIDCLHALDLGEAAHIIGNIMWDSIAAKSWGASNQEANAGLLNDDLRAWEKKTKAATRLQGNLTVKRLKCSKSGFPKLKAKGAQTRHLL